MSRFAGPTMDRYDVRRVWRCSLCGEEESCHYEPDERMRCRMAEEEAVRAVIARRTDEHLADIGRRHGLGEPSFEAWAFAFSMLMRRDGHKVSVAAEPHRWELVGEEYTPRLLGLSPTREVGR